jgi:methionyl-tRNA formyltransferase
MDNAKEFGVSIHEIDTRIDNGALLFETRFPIPENTWVKDLYDTTEAKGIALFKDTIDAIINGNYTKMPQAALSARGMQLHFRKEINDLKCIDLNDSKEKIARTIRAASMPGFEPPYSIIDGKKIYFTTEN